MNNGKHGVTPLAAVLGGLLAGAAGTLCMDTVRYVRYRCGGGKEGPLAWEFGRIDSWEQAAGPGQVARRPSRLRGWHRDCVLAAHQAAGA